MNSKNIKKEFQLILSAVQQTDNEMKKLRLGKAFFGTMFEDVVRARDELSLTDKALLKNAGAAIKLQDQYKTFGNNINGVVREVVAGLAELGLALITETEGGRGEPFTKLREGIKSIFEIIEAPAVKSVKDFVDWLNNDGKKAIEDFFTKLDSVSKTGVKITGFDKLKEQLLGIADALQPTIDGITRLAEILVTASKAFDKNTTVGKLLVGILDTIAKHPVLAFLFAFGGGWAIVREAITLTGKSIVWTLKKINLLTKAMEASKIAKIKDSFSRKKGIFPEPRPTGIFQKAWTAATNVMQKAWGVAVKAMQTAWTASVTIMKTAWTFMTTGIIGGFVGIGAAGVAAFALIETAQVLMGEKSDTYFSRLWKKFELGQWWINTMYDSAFKLLDLLKEVFGMNSKVTSEASRNADRAEAIRKGEYDPSDFPTRGSQLPSSFMPSLATAGIRTQSRPNQVVNFNGNFVFPKDMNPKQVENILIKAVKQQFKKRGK